MSEQLHLVCPEAAPQNIIVSYKLTGLFFSKQKSAYFMGVKVFYLDYRFADEDVMDEKDNDESFSLLPHWPLTGAEERFLPRGGPMLKNPFFANFKKFTK